MKCKNCARYVCVNDDNERILGKPNWCFYLSDSPCPDLERDCKAFIPLKNADRIRAMTDEELAGWIISITEDDTDGWLKWMKQEAID